MKIIKAFINGVREFRLSLTTNYDNDRLMLAYDWGREVAHLATLRRYEG